MREREIECGRVRVEGGNVVCEMVSKCGREFEHGRESDEERESVRVRGEERQRVTVEEFARERK